MTVQIYDPIPGQFDHRSGDCVAHGDNVPHARMRGSTGPYACVACLLMAAKRLAEPPVPEPPVPEPQRPGPPPPPPGSRYRDAARFLRNLTDPESVINRAMRGVAKLCEVAVGLSTEQEVCHRITRELTHLDDVEPEFWAAHEIIMRERAQARAQGYAIGRAESSNGRPSDTLRAKYDGLLTAARELSALLDAGGWTAETWRAARHKLKIQL
jgi:hypothetical protein